MIITMLTLMGIMILCVIAIIVDLQKEINEDRHTIKIILDIIRDMDRRGVHVNKTDEGGKV